MFKYKFFIAFCVFTVLCFCCNINNTYASITLFDFNGIDHSKCTKNMPKKVIRTKTLTGLFGGIYCESIIGCELLFKLDNNQNYDYIRLHKAGGLDDYIPFRIIDKYKNFDALDASKVEIQIARSVEYSYEKGRNGDCSYSDTVISIKSIRTEEYFDDLLDNASQVKEDRISIGINGFQLGMNEFNFLLNAKKFFPNIIKNHPITSILKRNPSIATEDTNIYFLFDNIQHKKIKESENIIPPELKFTNYIYNSSIAFIKDGKLALLQLSGGNFENIFKFPNKPAEAFVHAFSQSSNITFDSINQEKDSIYYSPKDVNLNVKFIIHADKPTNEVIYIQFERIINKTPKFN